MFGISHIKAIIEISAGSRSKYEIDKETGLLVLDRELTIPYPANYGFIPDTLSEDGDALDIFIVSHYPIDPLTVVRYKPIGHVAMLDRGVEDDKIIATLPGYDLPVDATLITAFLENYKANTHIVSLSLNELGAYEAINRGRLNYFERI